MSAGRRAVAGGPSVRPAAGRGAGACAHVAWSRRMPQADPTEREPPVAPGMMVGPMAAPDRTLAERLLAGDKRALARAISLVENDDPEGWALVRKVYPQTGSAMVIGFTGPPGAGKSTLLGALTKLERDRDKTVAVLAIDPSSPFTQGA